MLDRMIYYVSYVNKYLSTDLQNKLILVAKIILLATNRGLLVYIDSHEPKFNSTRDFAEMVLNTKGLE